LKKKISAVFLIRIGFQRPKFARCSSNRPVVSFFTHVSARDPKMISLMVGKSKILDFFWDRHLKQECKSNHPYVQTLDICESERASTTTIWSKCGFEVRELSQILTDSTLASVCEDAILWQTSRIPFFLQLRNSIYSNAWKVKARLSTWTSYTFVIYLIRQHWAQSTVHPVKFMPQWENHSFLVSFFLSITYHDIHVIRSMYIRIFVPDCDLPRLIQTMDVDAPLRDCRD
jgi:hypothetical protein